MHKRLVLLGICVAVALAAVALKGVSPAVGAGGDTISGTVFFDLNLNGQRDLGEPPAPGATVELLGGPVQHARTDSDGHYSFTGVQSSSNVDYVVRMSLDSTIPCATATTFARDVPRGTDSTGIDLGVFDGGTKTVSGVLVNDQNENGRDDAGEPRFDGWKVRIYGQGGPEDRLWAAYCDITSASDQSGRFNFVGLPPGHFFLELTPPSSLAATFHEKTFMTPDLPGTPGAPEDTTNAVDLTGTADTLNVEVGFHFLSGESTISGRLFSDDNHDGVWNDGERLWCSPGAQYPMGDYLDLYRDVPEVGVLYVIPGSPLCDDGTYRFDNLPAGTYTLRFKVACYQDPSNSNPPYQPASRQVTLADGQRIDGIDIAGCAVGPSMPPDAIVETPGPSATTSAQPSSNLVAAPNTGGGSAASAGRDEPYLIALLAAGAALLAAGIAASRRKGASR
ncbi:MAG: SdrD B-like domain-containing protein [Dehalococcoidia bacterium]